MNVFPDSTKHPVMVNQLDRELTPEPVKAESLVKSDSFSKDRLRKVVCFVRFMDK